MSRMFRNFIKNTFIYDLISWYRHKRELYRWIRNGKKNPIPILIKQATLKEYSSRYKSKILIETGTYMGFMVLSMKKQFDRIISIELSKELYERAKNKFSRFSHIEIINGDSSKVLPVILQRIEEPALFWLDAHFSGEGTARGNFETPIIQEIEAIIHHKIKNHVILIDDAHCFTGYSGYPSLSELKACFEKANSQLSFEVANNIVRISGSEIIDKLNFSERSLLVSE